jgi:hypothetical protein
VLLAFTKKLSPIQCPFVSAVSARAKSDLKLIIC